MAKLAENGQSAIVSICQLKNLKIVKICHFDMLPISVLRNCYKEESIYTLINLKQISEELVFTFGLSLLVLIYILDIYIKS